MNLWEIHPALVHFPIGFLVGATVLDAVAQARGQANLARAAMGLLVAGILTALVAAPAGALAYVTVPPHSEAADDRILLHALWAVIAAVLYLVVLALRWRHRADLPGKTAVTVSLAAVVALLIAGARGGQLVYRDGVGVAVNDPAPLLE